MTSYSKDCLNVSPTRPSDPCLYSEGHEGLCSWQNSAGSRLVADRIPTFFDQVTEFHRTAQVSTPPCPTLESPTGFSLTLDLIAEEYRELEEAFENQDIVELADAICDLAYVVLRAGYVAGLPINELFAEVHRSNMSKFPDGKVLRRADGKILKPESFTKPNLASILKESL